MKKYQHVMCEVPASTPFPALCGLLDQKKNEEGLDYLGHMVTIRQAAIATAENQGQPAPYLVLIFRREVLVSEEVRPDVPVEQLASVIH